MGGENMFVFSLVVSMFMSISGVTFFWIIFQRWLFECLLKRGKTGFEAGFMYIINVVLGLAVGYCVLFAASI